MDERLQDSAVFDLWMETSKPYFNNVNIYIYVSLTALNNIQIKINSNVRDGCWWRGIWVRLTKTHSFEGYIRRKKKKKKVTKNRMKHKSIDDDKTCLPA